MSTIQSASTPPPSPPMARMAILIGCCGMGSRSERIGRAALGLAALQPADHPGAKAFAQQVPTARIADDLRLVERRAQHRSVRNLAAHAAADATVEHSRDRVDAQRVGVGL